jgi:hypothetical protein
MSMFKTRTDDIFRVTDAEPIIAWPSDDTDEIDDDAFARAIAAGRQPDLEHGITVAA